MNTVEQDEDDLNSTTEVDGDAFMAWGVLSTKLEDMPEWVRNYFEKLIEQVDAFDPHEDAEIALTAGLEVPITRSHHRRIIGAKSKHDYAQIFDWVDGWRRTKDVNLQKALEAYIDEHDLEDGLETIKVAYHVVRRARLEVMDQERSDFT